MPNTVTILNTLPNGVRHLLFSFIPNRDFANIPVVCKEWLDFANELEVLQSRYHDEALPQAQARTLFSKLIHAKFEQNPSLEKFASVAYYTKAVFYHLGEMLDAYHGNSTVSLKGLVPLYATKLAEIQNAGEIKKEAQRLQLLDQYYCLVNMPTLIQRALIEVDTLREHYPLAAEVLSFYITLKQREVQTLNNAVSICGLTLELIEKNIPDLTMQNLVRLSVKKLEAFKKINMLNFTLGWKPISLYILEFAIANPQVIDCSELDALQHLGCTPEVQQQIIKYFDHANRFELKDKNKQPFANFMLQYQSYTVERAGSIDAARQTSRVMFAQMHTRKSFQSEVIDKASILLNHLQELEHAQAQPSEKKRAKRC